MLHLVWDTEIYWDVLGCTEILAQSFLFTPFLPVSMVHVWFMSDSSYVAHRSKCSGSSGSSGTESAVPPLIDARPWSSRLRVATPVSKRWIVTGSVFFDVSHPGDEQYTRYESRDERKLFRNQLQMWRKNDASISSPKKSKTSQSWEAW